MVLAWRLHFRVLRHARKNLFYTNMVETLMREMDKAIPYDSPVVLRRVAVLRVVLREGMLGGWMPCLVLSAATVAKPGTADRVWLQAARFAFAGLLARN